MLKETIKYDDLDGNETVGDFYFNMTKLDLIEMDLHTEGGLQGLLARISHSDTNAEAYDHFKDIILNAYGKRDGQHFRKKDPITGRRYRDDLEASPALGELIFSFLTDAGKGATFVEQMLPKKLVEEAKALIDREKAQGRSVQAGLDDGAIVKEVAEEGETEEQRRQRLEVLELNVIPAEDALPGHEIRMVEDTDDLDALLADLPEEEPAKPKRKLTSRQVAHLRSKMRAEQFEKALETIEIVD